MKFFYIFLDGYRNSLGSAGQRGEKLAQLVIDVVLTGDGAGNFGPQGTPRGRPAGQGDTPGTDRISEKDLVVGGTV